MLILWALGVLSFFGLHIADAALPVLRRTVVREALGTKGLRASAATRLRAGRASYEDLIWLLTLLNVALVTGLGLGLLARATTLAAAVIAAIIAAQWLVLFVVVPPLERTTVHLSTRTLASLGVVVQAGLWPLLPLRHLTRSGLRLASRQTEPAAPGVGGAPGTTGQPVENVEQHGDMDLGQELEEETLGRMEQAMIHAILHLDETPVREIMVPRVDMTSVDVGTPLEDAVVRVLESGHSRVPVFEEHLDNVVGVLYIRDLLAAATRGRGASPPTLRELVRPCFFVPESKRADEMLTEFQERHVQIAVVVDEYGGVAGLLTTEDLIEEIVGEIEDEFDIYEPHVERDAAGNAVVDARMPVDKFNAEFGSAISAEGYDTIGGFLYTRLGRIPTAGDVVDDGGLQMQVTTTVGRRIKKVRVSPRPPEDPATDAPALTGGK
ncbi:MAG: hemolysin family protein [Chloroflexota bacterium]